MIHIDNLYYDPNYDIRFGYVIDNTVYEATSLENYAFNEEEIEELLDSMPIVIDLNPAGSKPIVVVLSYEESSFVLTYQEVDGQLINLNPRSDRYDQISSIDILKVPLPGGQHLDDAFQELNLRDPSEEILIELRDDLNDHRGRTLSFSVPLTVSNSPSPMRRNVWLPDIDSRSLSPRIRSHSPDYEALTNQLTDLSSKYEALLLSHEALIKQV